jgi:GAF domain-containing protein
MCRRATRFAGVTTLTCTPISAAGRWLGVIFADRGGGRFELTEEERRVMLVFGKAAALAATPASTTATAGREGQSHSCEKGPGD